MKARKLEEVAATLDDLAVDLDEVTDGETTDTPQAKAIDEAKVAIGEASDAVDESLLPVVDATSEQAGGCGIASSCAMCKADGNRLTGKTMAARVGQFTLRSIALATPSARRIRGHPHLPSRQLVPSSLRFRSSRSCLDFCSAGVRCVSGYRCSPRVDEWCVASTAARALARPALSSR